MIPVPQLEEYEVIRKLGSGNMGLVYLAVRRDTGQQVAIKVVSGGRSPEEQEKIAIEKEGAELQQRISRADPLHIVAVNRFLFRNGDLIVEMEYVPGANLGEIIRNEKVLSAKRAALIALKMTRMLAHLEGLQPPVVHGDLKPGNVIVRGEAEVKVVDFGIAKQLAHGRGTFNQYQSIPYASPERLRTGEVDAHADLWAVAVMLYEMAAGTHPFSAPMNMIRMRILDGRGPDPLPAACPPELANVILKALANSPAERYPSAEAMARDLHRFVTGRLVEASRPVVSPDPDATVRTARPGRKPPEPPPVPPMQYRRWHELQQFIHRHRADVRLIVVGINLFVAVFFIRSQYAVGKAGGEARRALVEGRMTIDQAWDKDSELRKSAWLPFLLWGLQDVLKAKLLEEGTEPIVDYRRDQPTATLGDWERSESDLRRLLELDPRNKVAKAREQLCEGHIARMKCRYVNHGHVVFNSKLLSQAIGHFQQAADLMPDSADPYLALAPVYLYYEQDYERGMAMQQAAVKRGHTAGKRETAQMADTLKANARRDLNMAQQLNNDPDRKKRLLQNAVSEFESSIEYYLQIAGFAQTNQALKEAMQGKQQAQTLLDAM